MQEGTTPAIFLRLLEQLNSKAYEKEVLLQVEESGNKVALLQGFLAGTQKYKSLMRENGYTFDIKYDGTTERGNPYFEDDSCTLEIFEMRAILLDFDELAATNGYKKFKELLSNAIDKRKDLLFYESEKGRDLHFTKGWYAAITYIDELIERLTSELEDRDKVAAESLPF